MQTSYNSGTVKIYLKNKSIALSSMKEIVTLRKTFGILELTDCHDKSLQIICMTTKYQISFASLASLLWSLL